VRVRVCCRYDYCCHPQKESNGKLEGSDAVVAQLKRIQNWTLANVNKLYLNLHVLILLDMQYIGRFWCAALNTAHTHIPLLRTTASPHPSPPLLLCRTLFEAYLSFRRMSPDGTGLVEEADVSSSDYEGRSRRTIISVYQQDEAAHPELKDESKQLITLLETIWRGKTVQQAYRRLAMPDIVVTNQKDKLVQLKKLRQLQRVAQQGSRGVATRESQEVEMHAEDHSACISA